MKKKIFLLATIMVMVTATTVLAKTLTLSTMRNILNRGYSETDAYSMMAIISGCDDTSFTEIEAKFKELGEWKDVAEFFGVSQSEYEAHYQAQADLKEITEIPDSVYNEMIASGMTEDECYFFAISAFNGSVDVSEAWEAKKIGKTINDLIEERTALEDQKLQTATDYVYGIMSEEDYMKKMQSLSPNMPMSEIIEFAAKERKSLRKILIATSGITEDEIAFAEKCGMTDVIAMCKLKNVEKISEKNYAELVQLVGSGESVEDAINNHISSTKIEKAMSSTNIN